MRGMHGMYATHGLHGPREEAPGDVTVLHKAFGKALPAARIP
ncbi:hypothetical protein VLK31_22575 [Variovorax sp. H27-G14]